MDDGPVLMSGISTTRRATPTCSMDGVSPTISCLLCNFPPTLTGATAAPGTMLPFARELDQISPGKAMVAFGSLPTPSSG